MFRMSLVIISKTYGFGSENDKMRLFLELIPQNLVFGFAFLS